MNLTTSQTLTSKLHPEISYDCKKFSEGRRQDLALETAESRYKYFTLIGDCDVLLPKDKEATIDETIRWKRNVIADQFTELERRELHPAWIRKYVKEIHGLEFDGTPATVDSFISEAPEDLFLELVGLIKGQAELTDTAKNG